MSRGLRSAIVATLTGGFALALWVAGRVAAWAIVALVRLYQWMFSPLVGRRCRFTPSCSEYMVQAVRKYGALCGAWRGLLRICRCHPWHPGGFDPP